MSLLFGNTALVSFQTFLSESQLVNEIVWARKFI